MTWWNDDLALAVLAVVAVLGVLLALFLEGRRNL